MICGGVHVRQHKTNAETILRCGAKCHECGSDDFCSAHARSNNKVSGETTAVTTEYLVKHETLTVKHDADPLRAAIDNRVRNLSYVLLALQPLQEDTNFNLLHMPLGTPITEFTAYGEVVEVTSTLEFLGNLP